MNKNDKLFDYIDAVVILSWSNWFTELRSNRYHYATRFARHIPVLFVQPDLLEENYEFEKTDIPSLKILHLSQNYNTTQVDLFNQALIEAGIIRPILWIYNGYFKNIIASRFAILKVYHGTEDYFSPETEVTLSNEALLDALNNTLIKTDLVIAVSDGVKESFEEYSSFMGTIQTVTNGCDYKFYSPLAQENLNLSNVVPEKNVILYQGNIFNKIDFELMHALAKRLPTWQFNFCGKVIFNEPEWQALALLPNVSYLGLLTPEELKKESYRSTLGIIPFVENKWLVRRSFPLKAFEYVAAGLPVVSIPINSLLPFSDILLFASGVDAFEVAIQKAASLRFDEKHTALRLKVASKQDYDLKFEKVQQLLEGEIKRAYEPPLSLRIVIFYEPSSIKIATMREYLSSFYLYSKHNISYLPATQGLNCETDLNDFDVVMIHYSVRVSVLDGSYMLSQAYIEAIKKFGGYKILFLQDEYEGTNIAKFWITCLGIHAVYTCVPEAYIEQVYPRLQFPSVDFIPILTGYVSNGLLRSKYKHLDARKTLIGYRGRALPYWYGSLGQEKLNIGIQVKAFCVKKGLKVDIEWEESKRIYGDAWYTFLASSRATLGTESGANIFDYDGSVRATLEAKLKEKPGLTYESIAEEYIVPYETIRMNQISPKMFEAIALRTALILFEGEYSGVLEADRHYISLKKDFSNLELVISKVQDDDFIEKLTERAYTDIIESNRYSYQTFVREVDGYLFEKVEKYLCSKGVDFFDMGEVALKNLFFNSIQSKRLMFPSHSLYGLKPSNSLINNSEFNDFGSYSKSKYEGVKRKFLVLYSLFLKGLRTITPGFVKIFVRKSIPRKLKLKLGFFIHRFL
jgi:hypothetical protein